MVFDNIQYLEKLTFDIYVLYFYQSYHLYQFKTHFIAIAKKKTLAS